MTERRKQHVPPIIITYLQALPNRSFFISNGYDPSSMANIYKEAKTCLVLHSYSNESGGEYHRLSEMAPLVCVPITERFSDRLGMKTYENCGAVVFDGLENLASTTIDVVRKIDRGDYEEKASEMIDWWEAGIQWEQIFPTVFPRVTRPTRGAFLNW